MSTSLDYSGSNIKYINKYAAKFPRKQLIENPIPPVVDAHTNKPLTYGSSSGGPWYVLRTYKYQHPTSAVSPAVITEE